MTKSMPNLRFSFGLIDYRYLYPKQLDNEMICHFKLSGCCPAKSYHIEHHLRQVFGSLLCSYITCFHLELFRQLIIDNSSRFCT